MPDKKNNAKFINRLNYKDILIIFGGWYLILALNYLSSQYIINTTPLLGNFLHFLFISAGRFIYLALFIFYHISLYSISFQELGFQFIKIKQLTFIILLIVLLLLPVLIFINIPLSFNYQGNYFNPVYKVTGPEALIQSLIPFIVLYSFNFIIACSELLILTKIVFSLFSLQIKTNIALILSSLFYSFLLLQFTPGRILINLLIALIVLYLYQHQRKGIITPALLLAGYYTIYILYIYGWSYIRF